MALYAFDGTWQMDAADVAQDTNVVLFRNAYTDGPVTYLPGVGTRCGWLGKLAGGITGAGGHWRVSQALKAFEQQWAAGDRVVDVVGFSRGSALALHFANSLPGDVRVRFLGLFDTVPSFGIPGNDIDLGWKLGLPERAQHVFHSMAMDETRVMFPLHRLASRGREQRVVEVWFRGVHSDIGGGNGNAGLSAITLDWMFECARGCDVKLDAARIASNRALMNPEARVSRLPITSHLRPRHVLEGDVVHSSAHFLLA
jgi:uncharacterized protein (DUF2235 family)